MLSYSDSEVKSFHPICERALEGALEELSLDKKYKVVHHKSTSKIEMDFDIENKSSGKVFCVIEVKRHVSDVHSLRYMHQVMSYVIENTGKSEKPYYILTNIESAFAFRYDVSKPKPFQQILQPGFEIIADIAKDDESQLEYKLKKYYVHKFDEFSHDKYSYQLNLGDFVSHMTPLLGNVKEWKTNLAILLYEYIRGSFTSIGRKKEFAPIKIFGDDVENICNEAMRINFKGIFNYTVRTYLPKLKMSPSELDEMFELGEQNISGDSVADAIHSIVSADKNVRHSGVVATDLELARLVAILAQYKIVSLNDGDMVCDPAAGSGSLISAAVEIMGLKPTQIIANDVNPELIELITLRLGLDYASTIGKGNSPVVSNRDIIDFERKDFDNVKVILMNPPYVAGIDCVARKKPFFNKIRQLSGKRALTESGQMPLESVFLETVTNLVKDGTVIACVFPSNFLTGSGKEAQITRSLVLSKFGLETIFVYPDNDIFEDVVKSTCVLVGKVGSHSDNVKVISSYTAIPDINTSSFKEGLSKKIDKNFVDIMPGVQAAEINRSKLYEDVEIGWRYLNSQKKDALNFITEKFALSDQFVKLGSSQIKQKRGPIGNNGGSDLEFLNDEKIEELKKYSSKITLMQTSAAMRYATFDKLFIGEGKCDEKFLDVRNNNPTYVKEVVNGYIKEQASKKKNGKQRKDVKTASELEQILYNESQKSFPANTVLIGRDCRVYGRVYITTSDMFVSTNLYACFFNDKKTAILLGTWVSTVFYQLMCELFSTNQRGTRKMEVKNIKDTYIPILSDVSQETYDKLAIAIKRFDFLELRKPKIREIDKIWAQELFGEQAEDMLNASKEKLTYLANIRYPVR